MADLINLKDPHTEAEIITGRIIASAVLVVLLTAALIVRLYVLQVTQHDYQVSVAEKNRVHIRPIPPERGVIYDRNKVLLANNVPAFNLMLTRERAGDTGWVVSNLVSILDLSLAEKSRIENDLRRARRAFEPVTLMFDLSEKQIALVAVNQFLLPGVEVQAQFLREYPLGDHFAHSVGYVGRINEQEYRRLDPAKYLRSQLIGKTGIERFYEQALHGQMGFEEVETNAQGRVMRVLRRHNPVQGQDIVLTLDVQLQSAAEDALGDRRGAVVALDPATGQVLAMVSRPSFDPNPFVKGISTQGYAALRDSADMPLFNRVLRGLYPPGSTIKPMVVVAGLDSGVTTASSRVFDRGYYELPNYKHKYRNWNRGGDGWVDMYDAIMRSNDTYFYDLAHKLGVRRLHSYLSEFGLGQKVSMDLFEEAAGLMPSPEWKRATRRQEWYPGETLILGIGQGYMQVTPLQLAQATSLIANRGVWQRPHLALSVGGRQPVDPNPMANIVLNDAHIWDQVIDGMQRVMHNPRGVGRGAARGAQYRIAGKSGTAQVVAIKQGERYNRNKTHERHRDNALFVGFAPAEHPAIVVAVMIENGEAGARVAGPVVRKVMDAWLLDGSGHLKAQFAEPASFDKPASTLTLNAS
ncbi:penicillin-binding protein 2 [Pseudomonas sp. Fl5BN2]|uniref:penicillin-binding protein 2 n=1 Tax=Pseudomonas sp. Fl5BN2 TaxID=2697652 RepID=UPI001377CF4D|nr:penicillin-binding protein 2 [Pseudomonas sp. Fl5BN2]NBF06920.1 penicillin-binding protein 2 [Pseudomonas sp. Fl5BN2]